MAVKLVSDINVFDNISQYGYKPVGKMRFAFLFNNFPNFAAAIIESRVDSKEVSIIPQNFIRGNNGGVAIDLPGPYQQLAAVIFPIELNFKMLVRHPVMINGVYKLNVGEYEFLYVIFEFLRCHEKNPEINKGFYLLHPLPTAYWAIDETGDKREGRTENPAMNLQ